MVSPKLQAFIPFFYLVWSDDLLTLKEFQTLATFIKDQDWLSQDEKEYLLSNIDRSNPPSRAIIDKWKEEIRNTILKNPSIASSYDVAKMLSDDEAQIIALIF